MGKIEHVQAFLGKNASSIFTGFAVVFEVTSVILAVNNTTKASKILEKKFKPTLKTFYRDNEPVTEKVYPNMTKKEVVKATWKCYIPTFLSLSAAIGFSIASNRAGLRRSAALASLLTASEQALASFTSKAIENIGEKKTKLIAADALEEKVSSIPNNDGNVIRTGQGETLFYDDMCGRLFLHDIEKVREVINDLNEVILDDMYLTLNDLYYAIGIPANTCGNHIGWNVNHKGKIKYDLTAVKAHNGQPCLALVLHNWTTEYDCR